MTTDAASLHGWHLTLAICMALPAFLLTLSMCIIVALFECVQWFLPHQRGRR